MNPLFLQPGNFWVAEAAGQVQGFGQVRPVPGAGGGAFELASVYVLVRGCVRSYVCV